MEHRIAVFLSKNGVCAEKDIDIYEYGLTAIFSTVYTTAALLITGILLHRLPETLTFILVFVLLRGQSGGYHADSRIGCLATTFICYAASVYLSVLISAGIGSRVYAVIAAICTVILAVLAPGDNPNKRIPKERIPRFKCRSVIIATAMAVISFWFGYIIQAVTVSAMLCVVLLLIYSKCRRRSERNEEKDC